MKEALVADVADVALMTCHQVAVVVTYSLHFFFPIL